MPRRRDTDQLVRDTQSRARLATVAARLIVEHGLADWSLAKRKAARQLMLPERVALPADDEVRDALASHHALFGGEAHAATLRRQREEALAWLRQLAAFEPRLVGGVAAGWATEHSDIRIELTADDSKAVELALINRDVAYRVAPGAAQQARRNCSSTRRAAACGSSYARPSRRGSAPGAKRRWARRSSQNYCDSQSAASSAKYVRIASAPARLIPVSASSTHARSSSQPACAAALSIAYSPDTW